MFKSNKILVSSTSFKTHKINFLDYVIYAIVKLRANNSWEKFS